MELAKKPKIDIDEKTMKKALHYKPGKVASTEKIVENVLEE